MRKMFFSLTLIMLAGVKGFSTPPDTLRSYTFTYDESGNRILRESAIIQLKSAATIPSGFTDEQEQALEKKLSDRTILIYPNPTRGLINISMVEIGNDAVRVIVFNAQGQLVVDKLLEGNSGVVNLSKQPPGIYFMRIIIDGMSAEWKIVKE
jgi:hypothetical protein